MVEGYLDNGEPVGSELTRDFSEKSVPRPSETLCKIWNIWGCWDRRTSVRSVFNATWLRMFVDGLLEVGELTDTDRTMIDQSTDRDSRNVGDMLDRVSTALSGVTERVNRIGPKTGSAYKAY